MRSAFDAIVVGAGPAGSVTALHLARRGVRVLLVDRCDFPREKACGDGLTPRSVDILRALGIACACSGPPVVGIRLWDLRDGSRTGHGFRATARGTTHGLVVSRDVLDDQICAGARAAGATFWPHTTVMAPLRRDDGAVCGIEARRDGRTIAVRAPITLVADGAIGRLGRELRGRADSGSDLELAVRQYARGVSTIDRFEFFLPLVVERRVIPGYGWVFPAGDRVNIGAAFYDPTPVRTPNMLRRVYAEFLRGLRDIPRFSALEATSPLIGAPLRVGLDPPRCAGEGWMLVGDAAGVVNPFTGEGIAYALESGELAAAAAWEALSQGHESASHGYRRGLTRRYPRHVALRCVLPRLARMLEHGYSTKSSAATGGGRRVKLHAAKGAIPHALRRVACDDAPAVTGVAVRDAVGTVSPRAAAFTRRTVGHALATLRRCDPLVAESLRYLFSAPSALLGFPSALVGAVAASLGRGRQSDLLALAESCELFAVGHLLLRELKPSEAPHRYGTLALLWNDLAVACGLARLFELPVATAEAVLAGTSGMFRAELVALGGRPDGHDPEDIRALCVAGVEAAAGLCRAPTDVVAWMISWARCVTDAHLALGALVIAGGDAVLERGSDPDTNGSLLRQRATELLAVASHHRERAARMLISSPVGVAPKPLVQIADTIAHRAHRLAERPPRDRQEAISSIAAQAAGA